MKIICNKADIVNAINISQKAVSSKSTLQILEGLYLKAEDNSLKIVGNDLEIGIESTVKCDVLEEGQIVLNSRIFGEIIRKLPEDNITIDCDKSYNTLIKSKNSRFNIKGIDPSEFPQLPKVENEMFFQINQDVLKNMIRQTIFAVSTDENKQILTGSLIEIFENELNIVSVDGYRLAQRRNRVLCDKNISAVVPGKTLNEIYKILGTDEDMISISIDKNQILFENQSFKIYSRLLEGKFLNYKEIIPKEFETKVKVSSKDLFESVERASLISREDKKYPVKFNIKDEKLQVYSNAEIGEVNEEISVSIDGKDLEIGFNPKYFIDALKSIDSSNIELNFTTSYGPCVIKSPEDEEFIHLILPVRLK